MGWTEVGDRCFARRYDPFDVTVGAVVGSDGLLVIDTRGCLGEGRELRADLAALSPLPVRWVVNTHWHYDHCFGNAAVAGPGVPVYGHASVPVMLAQWGTEVRDMLAGRSLEYAAEMADLVIVPPTETFISGRFIDMGDRLIELVHPGRGHTGGDVVIRVPQADVAFVGDLVKSSGPPAYSPGSFPLDWPATVETVSRLVDHSTAVVPGHGPVVNQEYVLTQGRDMHEVARTISRLWGSGVPESDALTQGEWPYPGTAVADAVARGYAALRASSA